MDISVFGMGYVGCVTAACLSQMGNRIYCVEIVEEKISAIRQGRWPVYEAGLADLCERDENQRFANIGVSSDCAAAVSETDMSLLCVGTPSLPDGRVDLRYLKRTVAEISRAIKRCNKEHILIIRSTVPPGTAEGPVAAILKETDTDQKCAVAVYPEFMREGSAVRDFFEPSLNILGCSGDFPINRVKEAFSAVKKDLTVTSVRTAETIKYANNTFHALKIAFTNEFSIFCKAYGVDGEEVMELFWRDRILNLSPYYLKPGFAFGGSCLPKELEGLIALSQDRSLKTPLFRAILDSNEQLIKRALTLIFDCNVLRIGFYGITFKPNTDDIRESPVLKVIEKLLSNTPTYRKKFELHLFDRQEVLEKIKAFYGGQISTAAKEEDLLRDADLVVLGPFKIKQETERAILDSGKKVIDLKWHRVGESLRQYKNYSSLV